MPLQEAGGIEAFLRREVLPYAADAWYRPESVRTGYEISFTRYFYNPLPMRTLEEIRGDILVLEKETEGLLDQILGGDRPIADLEAPHLRRHLRHWRLRVTPEADALAATYIERGALTQRMLPDVLHIANAAIAQVDVLVSWNFKHVVNVQRIRTFNEVNREMGYGPLDIRSPREVGT